MKHLEAKLKARRKFKEGQDSEGIEILVKAIEKYPKNPEAYIELARYYMKDKNQLMNAVEILLKAEKESIKNAMIYGDVGVCFARLGHLEKAIKYQKKALRLDKENMTIISNIVKMLFNSGELVEARRFLDNAQEEHPHEMALYDTENWLNTAEVRVSIENKDHQTSIDS